MELAKFWRVFSIFSGASPDKPLRSQPMKYKSLALKIFNGFLFYVGWIVCIEDAMHSEFPLRGPLIILAILGIAIYLSKHRLKELIIIATVALAGTVLETIYQLAGIIQYHGGYAGASWIAPLWMTSLWALFGTSLNGSMSWASTSYWLAAVVGAIGGPFCYMAAISFGIADILVPLYVYLPLLGASWACIMPLSLAFAKKVEAS